MCAKTKIVKSLTLRMRMGMQPSGIRTHDNLHRASLIVFLLGCSSIIRLQLLQRNFRYVLVALAHIRVSGPDVPV